MTTVTFNRILQSGMSFLGVSIAIAIISSFFSSIGVVILAEAESEGGQVFGGIFILIALLVITAGSIGIFQKLISDAFLDGFMAAKESKGPVDGNKMGVVQTIKSGLQVIGIIILTIIISAFIFLIGSLFTGIGLTEDSDIAYIIGTLIYGSACALIIAIGMGMMTMILAEGVFFGAKNSRISFSAHTESSFDQTSRMQERFRVLNESDNVDNISTSEEENDLEIEGEGEYEITDETEDNGVIGKSVEE